MEKKSRLDQRREIKSILVLNGITQAHIAKELGVTRGAIRHALHEGVKKGRVYEWFKNNMGIDLEELKLKKRSV